MWQRAGDPHPDVRAFRHPRLPAHPRRAFAMLLSKPRPEHLRRGKEIVSWPLLWHLLLLTFEPVLLQSPIVFFRFGVQIGVNGLAVGVIVRERGVDLRQREIDIFRYLLRAHPEFVPSRDAHPR